MASTQRMRRISKEIEDFQKDKSTNLTIVTVGDDISHLKGTFKGPSETPYESGVYTIDIQIPNDYPFRPPKMKFDTRIYHPNISSQTGAICLDILKEQWSPVLTIKSALVSLQSMLNDPQPDDPQDAEVASHYLRDREGFDRTARYWAQSFASAIPGSGETSGVGSGAGSGAGRGTGTGEQTTHRAGGAGGAGKEDLIEMYGFDRSFVRGFTDMGFSQDRVIEVLRRVGVKRQVDLDKFDGGADALIEAIMR